MIGDQKLPFSPFLYILLFTFPRWVERSEEDHMALSMGRAEQK